MIRKNNVRLQITITKKQMEWLSKASKKLGLSKTEFIRFCLDANRDALIHYCSPEELEEQIRIAKDHSWLED